MPSKVPFTPGQTRFSTVAEVAGMLRVSKMTVYRLVHSEEIPHVVVGRSIRIPTAKVWDWLESQGTSQREASYDHPVPTPLRAVQ